MCEIVRPAYQKKTGPQYLWDLKGLNRSSARIAMRWAILMVSLAGIPPVYAFLGKAAILWQSMNKGLFALVFIA
jgi:NADH:ubiquinone oxidoreductase subunit 2 (subunit N)